MRAAYKLDAKEGIAKLRKQAEWLQREHPDALRAELELQGQSDYYADDANIERGAGYHVFNLRGSWRIDRGLELWGRVVNLADRKYPLTIENFGFGSRLRPSPPRSAFAGATYRF